MNQPRFLDTEVKEDFDHGGEIQLESFDDVVKSVPFHFLFRMVAPTDSCSKPKL